MTLRSRNPTIDFLLQLREAGVRRYSGSLPDGTRIEAEFQPTGPEATRGPAIPSDLGETARCPCSHEKAAEHSDAGLCYFGCPVTLCNPTLTAKPESAPVTG